MISSRVRRETRHAQKWVTAMTARLQSKHGQQTPHLRCQDLDEDHGELRCPLGSREQQARDEVIAMKQIAKVRRKEPRVQ